MRRILPAVRICLFLCLLLAACGPPATPTEPPAEAVAVPSPTSPEVTIAPTDTPAPPTPTPTPEPAITRITIDGDPSDWAGRPVLLDDPAGDAEGGLLDFSTGYAFVNQDAVYLLVEVVDPTAPVTEFNVWFKAGARPLRFQWRMDQGETSVTEEMPDGSYAPVSAASYSSVAFGPALEMHVDLRDLESPEELLLESVTAHVQESPGGPWRNADVWEPMTPPPRVDEVDPAAPPRLVSNEPQYALARRFQLPEGYVAERLFAPPLPNLDHIVRSESGTIYVQQWGDSAGISTLDPVSGQVTRLLDLPTEEETLVSEIVGGLDDTAFVGVGGEIWQISPDGSYTVWGQQRDGVPHTCTPDGRLLGFAPRRDDRTSVLELLSDGSSREVAPGFVRISDIAATSDGTLFVSDWETGNLVRVNPDGTQQVLVEHVHYREGTYLGVDPAGNLFLNSVATGFVQVDPDNGDFIHYDQAYGVCTGFPTGFVFVETDRVLWVDVGFNQVTWSDPNTGEGGLLVSNQGVNTFAVDIGPDDALYVGAWGCGNEYPAQILRITDEGKREVYVDGLRWEVRDIAFDPDGGLYVATFDYDLWGMVISYVPPGGGTPMQIPGTLHYNTLLSIAVDPRSGHLLAAEHGGTSILEFTHDGLLAEHPLQLPMEVFDFYIDVAPDGTVYAYCSEAARQQTGPVVERWVLRLDLENGSTEIVFQFDREGCCVVGNLSADPQGTLWWLVDPENSIYRVTPGGDATLFAQNLGVDPVGVAVDSQGDVYFTSPGGIYRIYREP